VGHRASLFAPRMSCAWLMIIARKCLNEIKISPKSRLGLSLFGLIQNAF
jgi:hypothetical protein